MWDGPLLLVTANGVGNAWVAPQLRGLRDRGLDVELVALRRPVTRYSEDPEVSALDRATRVLYPLAPGPLVAALLAAPFRFGPRLLTAAALALRPGEPTSPARRLRLLVQLVAAVALVAGLPRRPAHVHADMAHAPASVAMMAAALLGVGFSFTGHANDLFPQRVALRRKLRSARFVVAISSFHEELYRREGAAAERIARIPLGVEVGRLPRVAEPGEPTAEPRILATGRLVPKKGFEVLVDAVAQLAARGRRFRVEIAGTGPLAGALRSRVARVGLAERVVLHDRLLLQEEISGFLARGHVFCLPCVRGPDGDVDGLPLVLLEAACSGLPLVSTRLVGIPDVVEDGVTGLLVAPGDPDGLAAALERLLGDPALRARLGAAARERAVTRFDAAAALDRLAARLTAAAGAPPGPDRGST